MKLGTSTAGNTKQEIDRQNDSFTNRKIGRTRGRIGSVGPALSALDGTCIDLLTDLCAEVLTGTRKGNLFLRQEN